MGIVYAVEILSLLQGVVVVNCYTVPYQRAWLPFSAPGSCRPSSSGMREALSERV